MSIAPIPKSVQDQLRIVKNNAGSQSEIDAFTFDTIEAEPVDWLWDKMIARKKLNVLTGEEGIGKSWITCALASIVSNGLNFPNSENVNREPENVLLLALEDGAGDTLKPRLNAVGA